MSFLTKLLLDYLISIYLGYRAPIWWKIIWGSNRVKWPPLQCCCRKDSIRHTTSNCIPGSFKLFYHDWFEPAPEYKSFQLCPHSNSFNLIPRDIVIALGRFYAKPYDITAAPGEFWLVFSFDFYFIAYLIVTFVIETQSQLFLWLILVVLIAAKMTLSVKSFSRRLAILWE